MSSSGGHTKDRPARHVQQFVRPVHRHTLVLTILKQLHRVKREVFEGDSHALKVITQRIREEFRKNVAETDPVKIEEALVIGSDVVKLLRTSVVQLRQKDNDTFELRMRDSIVLPENTAFDPAKEIPLNPRQKKCAEPADSSLSS